MKDKFDKLMNYLVMEDKENSILYILDLLNKGEIDIVTLYQEILTPALNEIDCNQDDEQCIWKEHVRTSIVRSIIESAYPYVLNERIEANGKKVIVVCPKEELHEIGARMVHDYFEILGYTSTYIGGNTPEKDILSAVKFVKPDILAVSTTNPYNLVFVKRTIEMIREINPDIYVIVGGQAYIDENTVKSVGANKLVNNYGDLKLLEDDDNYATV